MSNNQKSETEDFVQKFYEFIYKKFDQIRDSVDKNHQNENLNGDDFISYFDKNFKNFAEKGYFTEKWFELQGNPFLGFHTEKEENFVLINTNIKNAQDKRNSKPFTSCKKLAEELGYDYKIKKGFYIPYSDFERKIKICAFEQLNRRVNYLKKRKEDLKKANENLKKEIELKRIDIKKKSEQNTRYEIKVHDLEGGIKNLEEKKEELTSKNSELSSYIIDQKKTIEDAKKIIGEKNQTINKLMISMKKKSSEFEKFKKNYGVVIYNIWRIGRTIEKDYKLNKQNFESLNNLIDLFGEYLENSDGSFEDTEVSLEFLENQKLLINELLKSLEKSYKQYSRVLILLEKSGIKIEEYDGIKNEEKLNVTFLDVIESSEVQEIKVETVKPSIYYADKRILEGEIILTKPKNK